MKVQMEVRDLTGEALDYAVAKANKLRVYKPFDSGIAVFLDSHKPDWVWLRHYNPSKNWAYGGPILEKYAHTVILRDNVWEVEMFDHTGFCLSYKHKSLLIAAMRCFVAFKLGYEVEVPGELFRPAKAVK